MMESFKFFWLAFLSVIGCCYAFNFEIEPKIVGGLPAGNGELPYQVSVMIQLTGTLYSLCGGTLYSNTTIITAAHCVYDVKGKLYDPSKVIIGVGSTNLNNPAVSRVATRIVPHSSYSDKTLKNDIALIFVNPGFNFTALIKTIPIRTISVPNNTSCIVSGWGSLYEGGSVSYQLMKTNVSITDFNSCKNSYSQLITIKSGMICAAAANKDACQGDSGGPLVCGGLLTGIVSFGNGCAKPGYPGVYTEVSSYASWIVKNNGHSVQNSIIYSLLLSFLTTYLSIKNF